MIHTGYILYVLFVVLLIWFRQRTRGASLDDLVERSAREHHQIIRIYEKYPAGGTWHELQDWIRQDDLSK